MPVFRYAETHTRADGSEVAEIAISGQKTNVTPQVEQYFSEIYGSGEEINAELTDRVTDLETLDNGVGHVIQEKSGEARLVDEKISDGFSASYVREFGSFQNFLQQRLREMDVEKAYRVDNGDHVLGHHIFLSDRENTEELESSANGYDEIRLRSLIELQVGLEGDGLWIEAHFLDPESVAEEMLTDDSYSDELVQAISRELTYDPHHHMENLPDEGSGLDPQKARNVSM